jgi:predicted lipoprotein with Yx(FWY)xxD motif
VKALTGRLRISRIAATGLAVAFVTVGVGLTMTATAVVARPAPSAGIQLAGLASPGAARSAVVVVERRHGHLGKILFTVGDRALYYLPRGAGSCTGSCLSVWPALLMPAGKTMPKGASCLGTVRFGPHHRLQVTYRGRRLYTFVDDSRGSVNGNGVQGFKVAKVMRCR